MYVYHIFIYSSVNGYLGCFHALAIINSSTFIFWHYCLVCQPLIILNFLKASGKHHAISHFCEFSHGVLTSWHLTYFFHPSRYHTSVKTSPETFLESPVALNIPLLSGLVLTCTFMALLSWNYLLRFFSSSLAYKLLKVKIGLAHFYHPPLATKLLSECLNIVLYKFFELPKEYGIESQNTTLNEYSLPHSNMIWHHSIVLHLGTYPCLWILLCPLALNRSSLITCWIN